MPQKRNPVPDASLRNRKNRRVGKPELIVELHADHAGVEASLNLFQCGRPVARLHETVSHDPWRMTLDCIEHGIVGVADYLYVGHHASGDGPRAKELLDAEH